MSQPIGKPDAPRYADNSDTVKRSEVKLKARLEAEKKLEQQLRVGQAARKRMPTEEPKLDYNPQVQRDYSQLDPATQTEVERVRSEYGF